MMGMAVSQFEGLRPSMGGSVILTHSVAARLGRGGRARLWVGREMRLRAGVLMARDEMGRRWRANGKRMVRRCMAES